MGHGGEHPSVASTDDDANSRRSSHSFFRPVDLADYLACWRPASRADLHVIPGALDSARDAVDRLVPAYGGVGALNLDLHTDLDGPGNPLVELDQLAFHCRARFLEAEEGDFVFTSSERLDGRTGTADLVVIECACPNNRAYGV